MNKWLVSLGLCVLLVAHTAAGEEERIDATDLDQLRASAGKQVTVVGHVTSVGTTQDGDITFINVGMAKKQGFVGVIFRKDYGAFPEGFDHFRNASVAISGVLDLYRSEQPQIKIRTPDQITIRDAE